MRQNAIQQKDQATFQDPRPKGCPAKIILKWFDTTIDSRVRLMLCDYMFQPKEAWIPKLPQKLEAEVFQSKDSRQRIEKAGEGRSKTTGTVNLTKGGAQS